MVLNLAGTSLYDIAISFFAVPSTYNSSLYRKNYSIRRAIRSCRRAESLRPLTLGFTIFLNQFYYELDLVILQVLSSDDFRLFPTGQVVQ